MNNAKRVLILDDEQEVCAALVEYLQQEGFVAKFCTTIESFKDTLSVFRPHFIILDKYISGADSFSVISQIRSHQDFSKTPVLIITGCEDLAVKINAINLGADDIIVKPLRLEEIRLKIQAIYRRAFSYQDGSNEIFYKNLKLQLDNGEVFIDSNRLPFTDTEFKLLQLLILEKGKPIRRESLASKSLTYRNKNIRTIDVHINSIRNKLGKMGSQIKTLRGRGYMLVD